MKDNWLSVEHIEKQELAIQKDTEGLFGKGRNGFCDYALDSIDLMIHGLYLRDIDQFIDKDKVKFNDFNHALRTFSYFHYSRIIYTFKATYNLLLQGYCTESAFLLRHVVETFVRLRYIAKEKNIDLIWQSWSGHRGFNGKRFSISYETQFNDVAQGLYKYYRTLCDMAHGAMASHVLRTDLSEGKINFDTGIVFRPKESTFVINQSSVYLLAHIEFMISVYPEIKNKMSERYAEKYHETLTRLWRFMKNVSENEESKAWYEAVQRLIRI